MKDKNLEKDLVGQEISGCEILSKIATGGMGSTFKARHKALDRIVCVKILSPALSDDQKAVSLFLTEARAIAELDHPNIVNVYNVGKEKGLYFIVMSFINGDTLANIVKRRPNLPIGFIVNTFMGVLRGLSTAHEKGIIHRDIKPSNILINDRLEPKIVDFGIATKIEKNKSATKTTEMAGTAYFIAPEQALGKNIDTRSDLYAVGASLYYTLTASYPYIGKNAIDIIQQHINSPIPNPRDKRKDIPTWLALTTQKLMAKKAEDRFQSAKEVIDYIIKMRAEEQASVKAGENPSVDIGSEMALRVRKDREPSIVLRDPSASANAGSASLGRVAEAKDSGGPAMPSIDFNLSPLDDDAYKKKNRVVPDRADTVSLNLKREGRSMKFQYSRTVDLAKKFLLHIPLFAAFTAGLGFVFYKLGASCIPVLEGEEAVHPAYSFIQALASAASPAIIQNEPIYFAAAVVMCIAAFALMSSKVFSRGLMWVVGIVFAGYLAGFYSYSYGEGGLRGALSFISANAFSTKYAFAYMLTFMIFFISILWQETVSKLFRLVAIFCVIITFICALAFFSVGVAPVSSDVFTLVKYSGILLALATVLLLLPKINMGSVAPSFLLLLTLCCIWTYNISGKVIEDKKLALEAKPKVEKELRPQLKKEAKEKAEREKEDVNDAIASVSLVGKKSIMSEKDKEAIKSVKITREEDEDIINYFARLDLLKGGSAMDMAVWSNAYKTPFINLRSMAQETYLYLFMLIAFVLGANVFFIPSLLFGEE
ncbi:Serine/threonine protein kinase [Parelusimicrobium proximum]|uniref:serine/threonine protein kinase n=1 Tax=Parelusimicrobium proximum TaxID=3228953 RepID=UPI003D16E169